MGAGLLLQLIECSVPDRKIVHVDRAVAVQVRRRIVSAAVKPVAPDGIIVDVNDPVAVNVTRAQEIFAVLKALRRDQARRRVKTARRRNQSFSTPTIRNPETSPHRKAL